MRKISVVVIVAFVFLLGTVPTNAQQRGKTRPIMPSPVIEFVDLQDDGSGGFVMFDPNTGAYNIQMCKSGFAWAGVGQIKIDGPSIFLSVVEPGYRVFVVLDMIGHQGKASVELFTDVKSGYPLVEPIYEEWSDSYSGDNKMDCVTDKK